MLGQMYHPSDASKISCDQVVREHRAKGAHVGAGDVRALEQAYASTCEVERLWLASLSSVNELQPRDHREEITRSTLLTITGHVRYPRPSAFAASNNSSN